MNYIIKSGLLVLSLSLCLPILGSNHYLSPNKNATGESAVVNAFLNKIAVNNPVKSVQINRIVIDAGHGGKDHGCGGHHSNEKHIVLDIAKQVKSKLREYHPELEVIMTREHDVFIPLFKRVEIANKSNADLFISIHCNSLDIKSVHGAETYVMGLHTAEENLAVAKRENEVIKMEQDYLTNYDGYDPYTDEGHIMLAMSQNEHLAKSINFANKLQRSFAKRTKLRDRGVKQAGFVVLKRATMPSVLIETGFITNKKDENYLMSNAGKKDVADAIVKAFTLYKRELDKEQHNYNDVAINSAQLNTRQTTISAQYTTPLPSQTPKPRMVSAHEINDPNHHKIISITATPVSTADHQVIVVKKEYPLPIPEESYGKKYKVQIAASLNKPIAQKSEMWQQVKEITIRQEENMYKYLAGSYATLAEANKAKATMRKLGFKGAFVVAYQGDTRTNL